MRVISGEAGGRPLKAVPGMGTRPTTDKVKEAVFSMIGPYFDGGKALDLFAGTGGLGIEALSRGMELAVFIDREKKSIDVIRDNLKATGLEKRAEVYRNDSFRALKALAKRDIRFDLVLLDPPYKLTGMDDVLLQLEELGLANPGAVVLIEHDAEHRYAARIGSFVERRHTEYGEIAITLYDYAPAPGDEPEGAETP
ncbi:methyltransferase [Paenibacillus sp. J31TS4]|uniref:16S rRNA (guanine(966)-N(2))-methyltransferase RsmD n=1 Tax=Paenibacillus sp. J31TS4 TaxID=2807195 RepID=UPI001B070222|nr:16S rRNA (guanine(966)-N(2))-methyltransferase RsmD [Paenibacillus sp. J31TS4]GIP36753.1 methyltransferase [Paenibacillus sp. J31TS4]